MKAPRSPGPRVPASFAVAGVHCAAGIAYLAVVLPALCGCGGSPPPATVEGKLHLGGRPLEGCLVTFWPEPGQDDPPPRHSSGLTDASGVYRLRYDDQQEGAAVGWHRVTVQDLQVSTGVRRRDHGSVDAGEDEKPARQPVRRSRVAERYISPTDTPLRKEVKPGHQVIDLEIR